jgi:ABC-2 type transport system permease protein
MTLVAMRLRGAFNGARGQPLRTLTGLLLLAGTYLGVSTLTQRALVFLERFPDIGTVADAVMQRSLEGLLLVLMVGVAFSVLTGAIGTLFGSSDLPFLLSQPVSAARVFGLKVAGTYVSSALLPAVFTVPVLVALGRHEGAPFSYYPLALLVLAALYALPVVLGALLALVLMRVAPEGRANEVATAASVIAAAGLILGMRALRPEQLSAMSPEEFESALGAFASFDFGLVPSTWAADAVWGALSGQVTGSALLLTVVAVLGLAGLAAVAAQAYRSGWFRSLDTVGPRQGRRGGSSRVPLWERPIAALGGSIVIKDLRLLLRDPSQWSQLLVLGALAGVYFISTSSLAVGMQQFRDAIGALNVAFLAFLLAGVGIRLAFPLVSLEGEALWLLRTAPVRSWRLVAAKFLGVLPVLLVMGVGLGWAVAGRLELSATLAFAAPLSGALSALAIAGLGVGLGASFPRFDSTNPAEIAVSSGGLLYMVGSFVYAGLSAVLFSYPAWRAIVPASLWRGSGGASTPFTWGSAEGLVVLGALLLLTALFTVIPLLVGSARLARWEPGA